jgi:hypothetical protein
MHSTTGNWLKSIPTSQDMRLQNSRTIMSSVPFDLDDSPADGVEFGNPPLIVVGDYQFFISLL